MQARRLDPTSNENDQHFTDYDKQIQQYIQEFKSNLVSSVIRERLEFYT